MMKPHEDPLVITIDIGIIATIKRVIINCESSMDVLYYDAFIKMVYKREDLHLKKKLSMASPIL